MMTGKKSITYAIALKMHSFSLSFLVIVFLLDARERGQRKGFNIYARISLVDKKKREKRTFFVALTTATSSWLGFWV